MSGWLSCKQKGIPGRPYCFESRRFCNDRVFSLTELAKAKKMAAGLLKEGGFDEETSE
jgi:hypothetical protein